MNQRGILYGVALALLAGGCNLDSSSTIREVDIRVAGVYYPVQGGRLVSRNSGAPITVLDVRQDGDRLEGIDNNGLVFRGTIGRSDGGAASFQMTGKTTTGEKGTMSGTFQVNGNISTMNGTWIEDSLHGTILGRANVPPQPEPGNGNGNNNTNETPNGGPPLPPGF